MDKLKIDKTAQDVLDNATAFADMIDALPEQTRAAAYTTLKAMGVSFLGATEHLQKAVQEATRDALGNDKAGVALVPVVIADRLGDMVKSRERTHKGCSHCIAAGGHVVGVDVDLTAQAVALLGDVLPYGTTVLVSDVLLTGADLGSSLFASPRGGGGGGNGRGTGENLAPLVGHVIHQHKAIDNRIAHFAIVEHGADVRIKLLADTPFCAGALAKSPTGATDRAYGVRHADGTKTGDESNHVNGADWLGFRVEGGPIIDCDCDIAKENRTAHIEPLRTYGRDRAMAVALDAQQDAQ